MKHNKITKYTTDYKNKCLLNHFKIIKKKNNKNEKEYILNKWEFAKLLSAKLYNSKKRRKNKRMGREINIKRQRTKTTHRSSKVQKQHDII